MMMQAGKVLIADDEALARQRLRRLLNQAGFNDIIEAENGEVALSKAREHRPDILMLDVRMPVIDGIEVAKILKRDAACSHAQVIFTTAYDEYALPAFDVSASGYLLKPINQDKMQAALNLALERSANQAASDKTPQLACSHKGGITLIGLDDIRVLFAEHKYVTVHHKDGEALVDTSLKQLESDFTAVLIRVHRNALVNKNHIKGLQKSAVGHELMLHDTDIRPMISRRWLPQIRQLLKHV